MESLTPGQAPEGLCYLSHCPPAVPMMSLNLGGGYPQTTPTPWKLLVEERQLTAEQLLMGTFSWWAHKEHLPALRGIQTQNILPTCLIFVLKCTIHPSQICFLQLHTELIKITMIYRVLKSHPVVSWKSPIITTSLKWFLSFPDS